MASTSSRESANSSSTISATASRQWEARPDAGKGGRLAGIGTVTLPRADACLHFARRCLCLQHQPQIDWIRLVVILVTAKAAHVSVNALNEYSDFRTGLDAETERTPFSGGSGALPANPDDSGSVLFLGLASIAVSIAGGFYLVIVTSWLLLIPGTAGVLIVAGYTPWMTRRPCLSLIMPGVAFGPIMVIGTVYVLTQQVTITAVIASMVPFFLANNLLLLNQYPDIEADRAYGRRNLPILFGTKNSGIVYLIFKFIAAAMGMSGILMGLMPLGSMIAVAVLVLALPIALAASGHVHEHNKLIPLMAMNVVVTLAVPVLLAISLFYR
jgi:1,4-dihydroxy-2-naphthoate octaprenyltransferase